MRANPSARTRDRLLDLLKTRGAQSTPVLARQLELTAMAVRSHLQDLEGQGLVQSTSQAQGVGRPRKVSQAQGVGRPRKVWSLTADADRLFPEGYGDLAVDLLQEARKQFGTAGVEALLQARCRRQTSSYARSMPPPTAALGQRVRRLARLRSDEGYMAEVTRHRDGGYALVENHCPVCAAARICVGLCHTELQMFRQLLGHDVTIERQEHILEGARRCTYRITPKSGRGGRKS